MPSRANGQRAAPTTREQVPVHMLAAAPSEALLGWQGLIGEGREGLRGKGGGWAVVAPVLCVLLPTGWLDVTNLMRLVNPTFAPNTSR